MKKIILSILSIIFVFAAIGQNLKGYNIEAIKKLEAKRVFVLAGDSVSATTKMGSEDTILVTKLYLQAEIDSASIAMQEPDSIGQFPVWNPDSGFFVMDNVYNYEPKILTGLTTQYWRGDKTFQDFNAASRNSISLTTNGSSGASTYNDLTGIFNIPNYTLSGLGGQPQLNGTGFVKANGTEISYDNTVVSGPASSTDNAIARFDGTTGKLIQNSNVTISDAGAIVTPSTIQASSAIFSGDINVNGSDINTTLNDFKININSTNQIYRVTRANAYSDIVNSAFQQFGALSVNDNAMITGAAGAVLNRFGITSYKFVFGGPNYNYSNIPSPVKDFNIYGISYFHNNALFGTTTDNAIDRLQVNGSILGTTAKFTNLTDNYIPKHTSDATGLQNSNIFFSGNIARYGTANTFSNDRDIVDKAYVDAIASGNMPKLPVDAATTGNITLSGTQTIDGYSAGVGARILVWKQTTASQNGVYIVASGAWTRATDLDTWAELYKAYVTVLNGAQSGSSFVCTVPSTGTLGTDPVTWILYNAPTNITVSSPLAKSGNNIGLGYDTNTLEVASNNLKVKDNVFQPLSSILTNTTASFTTTLETKLNGIETGAEVNVNADWNAVSGDAQILNKPTALSQFTNDLGNYGGFLTSESDPIFTADSANLLHWSDTLNLTKGIATPYDLTNYYTKTNLQTSGQSAVHWNNITNKPISINPALGTSNDSLVTQNALKIAIENYINSIPTDNDGVQTLTGTTPTWNVSNGLNAKITLTGATTITMSNLVAGKHGSLTVTNGGNTSYLVTFAGYTFKVHTSIRSTTNTVVVSGGTTVDHFSWYYDGTNVIINGGLNFF